MEIRHWWIQKAIKHNCLFKYHAAVFQEFKPSVSAPEYEWVKVLSADDLHKAIGINYTRYSEVMQENGKLKKIIAQCPSENDDLGAEYTHVQILKQHADSLAEALDEIDITSLPLEQIELRDKALKGYRGEL